MDRIPVHRRALAGTAAGLAFGAVAIVGPELAPAAGAERAEVVVADSSFTPGVTTIAVGDEVHWSRMLGSTLPHNVREDSRLFRSGEPVPAVTEYAVAFSAGTFHYFCEIHGSQDGGMDGTVRVPVGFEQGPSGAPFTVSWATDSSATGRSFDVQYRVGTGRWKRWLGGTEEVRSVFGKGGPVRVRAGLRYAFRARSVGSEGASRWSPPATMRTSRAAAAPTAFPSAAPAGVAAGSGRGSGTAQTAGQASGDVDVQDNQFSPDSIEIDEGGTVTWSQTGANPHSVTADDGSFDSHPNCTGGVDCMGTGDTFQHTFDRAGTFAYHCKIHGGAGGSGMSGVVVVNAAGNDRDPLAPSGSTSGSDDDLAFTGSPVPLHAAAGFGFVLLALGSILVAGSGRAR